MPLRPVNGLPAPFDGPLKFGAVSRVGHDTLPPLCSSAGKAGMVQTTKQKEKTMTEQTQKSQEQDNKSNLPTHVAKTRNGYGKNASYERIGVAWKNDDGSYYVKLHGTQVVSNFTLYQIAEAATAGE
jgi:hypothetical protein